MEKFARLLPNNWLVKTPQALAARRLGRQSAERERISGINWNGFQRKKTADIAVIELMSFNHYKNKKIMISENNEKKMLNC